MVGLPNDVHCIPAYDGADRLIYSMCAKECESLNCLSCLTTVDVAGVSLPTKCLSHYYNCVTVSVYCVLFASLLA